MLAVPNHYGGDWQVCLVHTLILRNRAPVFLNRAVPIAQQTHDISASRRQMLHDRAKRHRVVGVLATRRNPRLPIYSFGADVPIAHSPGPQTLASTVPDASPRK